MNVNLRLSALACALATGGCATLPVLQTERGVKVDEIVNATKCELASIMKEPRFVKDMTDWSAKVSLDLKVLYDNSGGPSGTLVVPYHAGTVEMSADVGGSAQSNRVGHLAYTVAKLQDLKGVTCDRYTGMEYAPDTLGLEHWLLHAIGSVTHGKDFVELDELSYTLEFVVERSGSGGIKIKAAGTPTTGSAGLGAKASAKDTNSLLVSLVPPPPKPRATRVAIVSWPGAPKGIVETPTQPAQGTSKIRRGNNKSGAQGRGRGRVDQDTQDRLNNLTVRQRLFNSITIPRNGLNTF